MRSLRGRLLAASAALVAIGLLAAGVATFVLVRSSLVDRVDRQLEAARPAAVRTLSEGEGRGFRGFPGRGPDEPAPPSTLATFVDAQGDVVGWRTFGFDTIAVPPELPPNLPGSANASSDAPTFSTLGSPVARYRVLATAIARAQGTVVVAIALSDVDATLSRLLLVEGLVGAGVLAVVVALSLWLVRMGLRPLEEIGATAGAIAAGDLTRRVEPADDTTEVGRLGRSLNVMLERIEAAFSERRASEERLRRFVADASHELRTPLTSIRGYAELFRFGADPTNPAELEKAMTRIEQESARMGQLVDELLLLARLDQGRPLERAPVDLSHVASDAVADARAVDASRPITLDAAEGVVVDGDDARLRQVAANLLSNARDHTPGATPVHVRVGVHDGLAVLEVADRGPGMTSQHAVRVFDRFYRVDPSRSREKGGVGLGLSIVQAVAAAHGGRVEVDGGWGRGATFRVLLPLHRSHERSAGAVNGARAPETDVDTET